MGSLGVCVWSFYTMTPSTTKPLVRGIISLSLSFACLITVFSVSVSWSLDLVSLCNWVFCLCLVFESDTADACRLVRMGGVERWLGGRSVLECTLRRKIPNLSPPSCPHFLVGPAISYRFPRYASPCPGISIKRSSTLSLTLSLSVSRWVKGLVSRSSLHPGKLSAF